MPNSFINFCYNLAGKREDMEAYQRALKKMNPIYRAKLRRDAREAARKRALNIKMHNSAVWSEARRGVRRPGRDYSRLFMVLDELLGNVEVKKEVICHVIEEALRFKRRALAQLLEEYMGRLEVDGNERHNQFCRHCAILSVRPLQTCNCNDRHRA